MRASLSKLSWLRLLSVLSAVILFVLSVTFLANPKTAAADDSIYLDSPDPDIIYVDGTYYLYTTQFYRFMTPLWTSNDAENWVFKGDAKPFQPNWGSGTSWGPSVVQLGTNEFVMYYSALHVASEPSTRCIGVATSTSPEGPFADVGSGPIVCDKDSGGQIDPYAYKAPSGELYLVFKDDLDTVGGTARLRSQRLASDGLSTTGSPTTIFSGQSGWEGSYVENPAMFNIDGTLYLSYSANSWADENYSTGYAICDTPSGPCLRPRPDSPFLGTSEGGIGPGGASVVTGTPAGDLIAYHTWENGVGYGQGGSRISRVEQLGNDGGLLRLSQEDPLPTDNDCQTSQVSELHAYQSSTTHRSLYRLYCAYFLREPEVAGYSYWISTSYQGVGLAAVSNEFAASDEFTLTYGVLSNSKFVTLLYQNTMRREPDSAGHAYWLEMLDTSTITRGEVVLEFSDSTEFRTLTGTF